MINYIFSLRNRDKLKDESTEREIISIILYALNTILSGNTKI